MPSDKEKALVNTKDTHKGRTKISCIHNSIKVPTKTEIERVGEFNTHEQAKEVASLWYDKHIHSYVGYGVMVKRG